MGNAVFLYKNYADAATLSGGLWTLPLSNAQSADIGIVAQSADAQVSSTLLVVDLGSAPSVGGVVVGPVNVTPGSSYRIQGFLDTSFGTAIYTSGIRVVPGSTVNWSSTATWLAWENPNFWAGLIDDGGSDGTPLYLAEIFPTDQAARYWVIEFLDPTNADGFIRFGRLMIAKAFRPSINYNDGDNALSFDFVGDSQETLGGLYNYWDRAMRRSWRGAFNIQESELFGAVFDMAVRSRLSGQVFVSPDPNDTANARKRNFLATMKVAPSLAQINVARGTTAFDFLEVT